MKKTKNNEIEIQNECWTNLEFMKKIRPKIRFDQEFSKYPPGKYYFYYRRTTTYWKIILFPQDKELQQIAGFFNKNVDSKEIKVYNSREPDEFCP